MQCCVSIILPFVACFFAYYVSQRCYTLPVPLSISVGAGFRLEKGLDNWKAPYAHGTRHARWLDIARSRPTIGGESRRRNRGPGRRRNHYATLHQGRRAHPIRGGRVGIPASDDARRRAELRGRQLAFTGVRRHGAVQRRLPLHHAGPAQRERRRVQRAGPGGRPLGGAGRRPARPDGPPGDTASSCSWATASGARTPSSS